jgi:hypothetical protein
MDARTHERTAILTEIELTSASGRREARISDLSLGGCFVDTIVTARVGEDVELRLGVNSDHPIEVSGTIAYILDGFGFGIAFGELTDEVRSDLAGYLEPASV